MRKRKRLEDDRLLDKVGVTTHPLIGNLAQYQSRFVGLGIPANTPFQVAYQQAEKIRELLNGRTKTGGFIKSLMLQRICSSFAAGLKTAQKMLRHSLDQDDEERLEEG